MGHMVERTIRRRAFLAGASTLGITSVAGCIGGGGGSGGPIKIGALAPNSGFLSIYGQENQRGYEFVLEQIDNSILDRDVKLVVADTESGPTGALGAAQQLIEQDNVDALVGVASSAAGSRVGQYLSDEGQVPLIASQVASANARQGCHQPVFYPWPSNVEMSISNAAFIGNELGNYEDVDTSAVHYVGLDYEMGQSSREVLGQELKKRDSEITGSTMVPPDVTDFSSYFPQIESADPEVLTGFIPGQQAVQFVTQAADYGLKEQKTFCLLGDTASLLSIAQMGEAANGMYSTVWYNSKRENDMNVEFRDWYASNYDDLPPNEAAANAVNQLYSLAQGMEAAGSTNSDEVINALEGMSFSSTYGELTYRASDHQTEQNMVGISVEDSQYQILKEYPSVIGESICSF